MVIGVAALAPRLSGETLVKHMLRSNGETASPTYS
jgi:hypothetical protein